LTVANANVIRYIIPRLKNVNTTVDYLVTTDSITGPTGSPGKGFRIFTTSTSLDELPNGDINNIGEFALITGGEMYVYLGENLGETGPNNAYHFVG